MACLSAQPSADAAQVRFFSGGTTDHTEYTWSQPGFVCVCGLVCLDDRCLLRFCCPTNSPESKRKTTKPIKTTQIDQDNDQDRLKSTAKTGTSRLSDSLSFFLSPFGLLSKRSCLPAIHQDLFYIHTHKDKDTHPPPKYFSP